MSETPTAGPSESLAADLELLDVETQALLATLRTMDPGSVGEPSRCAGWTRGHVLTHLARNAESLVRLTVWARTGVPTPQYPSQESRDADIEAGAHRSLDELADDVTQTAELAQGALSTLALPLRAQTVEFSAGPAPAASIPRRRLNEVVLHHHDLRTSWTLADAHPLAVADLLDHWLDQREGDPTAGGLTVVTDEGDRRVLGDGQLLVEGPAAAVLAWLARDDASGLRTAPHSS